MPGRRQSIPSEAHRTDDHTAPVIYRQPRCDTHNVQWQLTQRGATHKRSRGAGRRVRNTRVTDCQPLIGSRESAKSLEEACRGLAAGTWNRDQKRLSSAQLGGVAQEGP